MNQKLQNTKPTTEIWVNFYHYPDQTVKVVFSTKEKALAYPNKNPSPSDEIAVRFVREEPT